MFQNTEVYFALVTAGVLKRDLWLELKDFLSDEGIQVATVFQHQSGIG